MTTGLLQLTVTVEPDTASTVKFIGALGAGGVVSGVSYCSRWTTFILPVFKVITEVLAYGPRPMVVAAATLM